MAIRFYTNRRGPSFNPFSLIVGFLFLFLFMVGLFYLAKGLFWLLSWLTPAMIIATLIIRYQVWVDYGKMLWRNIKESPVTGILLTIVSILAFPFLTAFLLIKAILYNKVDNIEEEMERRKHGEWAEFEELDSTLNERIEIEEGKEYREL